MPETLYTSRQGGRRAARLPAQGTPIIGTVSLGGIMGPPFLNAFMGYKLDPACTGQGFMAKALPAAPPAQ